MSYTRQSTVPLTRSSSTAFTTCLDDQSLTVARRVCSSTREPLLCAVVATTSSLGVSVVSWTPCLLCELSSLSTTPTTSSTWFFIRTLSSKLLVPSPERCSLTTTTHRTSSALDTRLLNSCVVCVAASHSGTRGAVLIVSFECVVQFAAAT